MLLVAAICSLSLNFPVAPALSLPAFIQGGGVGNGGGGGGGGGGPGAGTTDGGGGGGGGSGTGGVIPGTGVCPTPTSSTPSSPPTPYGGTPPPVAPCSGLVGAHGATLATPATPLSPPLGADLSAWTAWWDHNHAPYLQLREKLRKAPTLTGSDDFFLGRGDHSIASTDLTLDRKKSIEPAKEALWSALAEKEPVAVRRAALLALSRIGMSGAPESEQFLTQVKEYLAAGNQEIAEAAVVALGVLGEPAGIEVLLELVSNTEAAQKLCRDTKVSDRLRAFSAYALSLAQPHMSRVLRARCVSRLMDLCEGEDFSNPEVEVALLAAIGLLPLDNRSSLDVLQGAVENGKPDRRVLSRRTQLAWLMERFESRAGQRKANSVRAQLPISVARLARESTPELREALAQIFLDALHSSSRENAEVRACLALALGDLGDCDGGGLDEKIRRALVAEFKEGDPMGRRFALVGLGRLAGRPGNGSNPEGGREAVRDVLLDALAKGRSQVEPWAALALGIAAHARSQQGEGSDPASAMALRHAAATSRRPQEIGAYALALGMSRDVQAATLLSDQLLELKEPEARAPLALALGLLGDLSTIPVLRELLQDSQAQPRLFVELATSLALAGDKDVVPDLLTILAESRSQSARIAASVALGRVGDGRALNALNASLGDSEETSFARAAAAKAIGEICDARSLPWDTSLSVGSNYLAMAPSLTDGQRGVLDYEQ